ncbi:nucleoside monophosphate kinase [Candidatus Saccharibacteria bacterium]|nr:nucleoside monophosphate kinase [Candidatus Saccharibacteria bacterium]MBR3377850.1 nucleoside monophosphate kinase [Candidatus Saccharibacteria bacterium]
MFILFGPAGSGKSLQGQILAEKYGWRWLSVGQLLRDQKNPALDKIMKEGGLVDDNFVVNMMHDAIKAAEYAEQNAILDGYPRDVWQAEWLVEHGDLENVEGAIILNVTKEELWKRLEARGRVDDKKDAIEKRWGIFEQTIAAMSEILEKQGLKIEKIDGVGSIEQITERIETVLRKWGTI